MNKMTDCKKMIDGKCFAECTNEGADECSHRCTFYDPEFDARKCIKELMTHYSERGTQSNSKILYDKIYKSLGSEADRIMGTDDWNTYYVENINRNFRKRRMDFWNEDRIAKLLELKAEGLSVQKIADTIGHTYAAVQQRLYQESHR